MEQQSTTGEKRRQTLNSKCGKRFSHSNQCFFIFLLFLLYGATAIAQSHDLPANNSHDGFGIIQGIISDQESSNSLADVTVSIEGTSLGAVTDSDGYFRITGIPAGQYRVTFSLLGYAVKSMSCNVTAEERIDLQVQMALAPISISETVVVREMLTGGPLQSNQLPGAAHYIDFQELQTHSNNDVNRILWKIPGVNLQEEDGYGLRPNIGLRGTGVERSQKITLMEDGILIAPAPYSAPAAYYFPTVGRMSALEIRKGSSQIKYGPYTTGGAINLISTPIPSRRHFFAKIMGGENNARTLHATIGDKFEQVAFLVEGYQTKADGFKDLDNGGNTGFDKKDYLLKLRLNTPADWKSYHELQFKFGVADEVSNETYLGLTSFDFQATPLRRYAGSQLDKLTTDHRQISLRYFTRLSPAIDFTATAYANDFKRNWYKLDRVKATIDGDRISISDILENPQMRKQEYDIIAGATSSNADALEVKANNREYQSRGIQSFLGLQFNAIGARHEIEIGLRYHEDEMDRFQWVDKYAMDSGLMRLSEAGLPGSESNRIEFAETVAGFVQYQMDYGRLQLIPGFRVEKISQNRLDYGKNDPGRTESDLTKRRNAVTVFIPGLGMEYALSANTSGFLGIHKGFAPPGSTPGANPEESINYEGGLRYSFDYLRFEGIAFFNDYRNLLGSDLNAAGGNGSGDLFNGGEVNVSGLELSATIDIARALEMNLSLPLQLAYTFTDAHFQNSFESNFDAWQSVESGDELPYLPENQFYAGLALHKGDFSFDFGGKYTSAMRTVAGQGAFETSQSTDAHLILDAALEYRWVSKHTLFLIGKNLSDERYIAARRPAGIRPGLPQTFMLGIRSEF